MKRYQSFIFKDYNFSQETKCLKLTYGFDEELTFTEEYHFDFDFTDYDAEALDRAVKLLFLMAGVSYYKAFMPRKIDIAKGNLNAAEAKFLQKTYQKGLGEFLYINHLDPRMTISFKPTSSTTLNRLSISSRGLLVGIGGGKDSLVATEVLRDLPNIATWSLNHRGQLEPLINTIGLPHFWVERRIDPQLIKLKDSAHVYNGHVPISAILACAGAVVAVLTGYRDIVVSNESTASEPNLEYRGVEVNHQYSKSIEFERDFQSILELYYGDSIRYYSVLRPFTELRIAELFSKNSFRKYKGVFSSCNKAFTHNSKSIFWCGRCPKCAFVYLALSPFIPEKDLKALFAGKNLLTDATLQSTYNELLGIEGHKPLECVGETKESRAAMRLAIKSRPELHHFTFDIDDDYDFRSLSDHSMPEDIYLHVLNGIK